MPQAIHSPGRAGRVSLPLDGNENTPGPRGAIVSIGNRRLEPDSLRGLARGWLIDNQVNVANLCFYVPGSALMQTPHQQPLENVSVIVVNYNAGDLLLQCVEAALAQAAQVVVVDNDSTDGSFLRLAQTYPNEVRLQFIRSGGNVGFAAGCNAGVKGAFCDNLLFLNPDCILSHGALRRMVAAISSAQDVGMVGGLLINTDGTEQGGGRRAVPTPWRSFVRAFGLSRLSPRWPRLFFDFHLHQQPLPDKPIDVEAISGALMLVKRAAIDDVGPWDEAYFLHCEDLDWCMRFRQRNWRILFVPDAPVIHHLGHSSKARPFFVEWHKHKGMVRFYQKFFSHQYPGILMWVVRLGVWFRFGLVSVRHTVLWVKTWLGAGGG